MNLNDTPPTTFQEVKAIMLQPAPWSDEEIEELMHQPPLNQSPQLSAEEPTEETNEQIESNR